MKRSIERALLAWILGAMCLGTVLVALVTYLGTLEEMSEFFDANLKEVAEVLGRRDALAGVGRGGEAGGAAAPPTEAVSTAPGEYEIVAMAWSKRGERLFASHAGIELPFSLQEGRAEVRANGEQWVVYTVVGEHSVAQAAQSLAARRFMARETAGDLLAALLAMVAAVVGLLMFALRRGLKPLDAAAAEVAARSAATLAPIDTDDVPRELAPLVSSINGLMARLDAAITAQRSFVADAAHELRTPLTALKLQQQLLARSADEASRREALERMALGIERAQRLVEQLLEMARAAPDNEALRLQAVDLTRLAKDTVAGFAPRAEQLHIDLGADAAAEVIVQGDLQQLRVLLNNLVDNALRYTPAGGVVDVGVGRREGRPVLFVSDNGPGIAEAERGRVFDRFFRGEAAHAARPTRAGHDGPGAHDGPADPGSGRDKSGSGLGLAIVQAIAERHGAQVRLATPRAGSGLLVEVVFAPALR